MVSLVGLDVYQNYTSDRNTNGYPVRNRLPVGFLSDSGSRIRGSHEFRNLLVQ